MFTEDMLENILLNKEMQCVPLGYQSTVLHVCEKVLEDFGYDFREKERNDNSDRIHDY